jgi:hypothetical protein
MNIYFKSGIIMFSLILVSIILYFIFKPHNDKQSPLNNCKDNKIQCGTGCYDKKWQSCDSKKQICDSHNFSQDENKCCISPETLHNKTQIDEKGNKKIIGTECCKDEYWSEQGNVCCDRPVCGGFCCENTKYCDYSIVDDNIKNKTNNNPCVKCENILCGLNCCPVGKNCYTGPTNTLFCCNHQLWDPDTKICCDGSTGAVNGVNCHPGGNPKCNPNCNEQQTCIVNNVCCDNVYDENNNLYSCIDQNFNNICCPKEGIKNKCQLLKNGQYICCDSDFTLDEKNQRCFEICGTTTCDPNLFTCAGTDMYKYCQTKGCLWDTNSNYDPPNYVNNIIFSYKDKNNLTKYYYANPTDVDISQNLKRTITFNEIDKEKKCQEKDCEGKVNEEGASSIFDIKTHKCIGKYDSKEIINFPSASSNPPCPYEGSCVLENGMPTGQICLNMGTPQKAYNSTINNIFNMEIGDCICNEKDDPKKDNCKVYDSSLCNNFGTPDEQTGKCNCVNSSGDKCQYNKPCPNNCSNNGNCNYMYNTCTCNDNYTSKDCSEPVIRFGDIKYRNWIFRWSDGSKTLNTTFKDTGTMLINTTDETKFFLYKIDDNDINKVSLSRNMLSPSPSYGIPSFGILFGNNYDPVAFTFDKTKNIYTSLDSKTIIFNSNHLNYQSSIDCDDNPQMNICVSGYGPPGDCSRKLFSNTPVTVNMNCRGSSVSWSELDQSCKDTLGSSASVIHETNLTCAEDNCSAGNWRYACSVPNFYASKYLTQDTINSQRCIGSSTIDSTQFLSPNGFIKYN